MIRLQVLYPHPYPLPLYRLSSLPLLSPLPLAHPLVHKALWGFVLPLLMSAVGLAQMALSPPRTSLGVSACMSVCIFIFRPCCPLTHLAHSSLLCSHHLQSSSDTAGLWWTLFQHGSDGSTVLWRAKWVETAWEASSQPPLPDPQLSKNHSSSCMVKQPWGSFLQDHYGY